MMIFFGGEHKYRNTDIELANLVETSNDKKTVETPTFILSVYLSFRVYFIPFFYTRVRIFAVL